MDISGLIYLIIKPLIEHSIELGAADMSVLEEGIFYEKNCAKQYDTLVYSLQMSIDEEMK